MPQSAAAARFPYTTLFRAAVWRAGSEKTRWRASSLRRVRASRPDRPATSENVSVACGASERRGDSEQVAQTHRACARSEEHTSELQSHHDLVCRLRLEK